jgi:tRNA(Ile)-lysidine synthase
MPAGAPVLRIVRAEDRAPRDLARSLLGRCSFPVPPPDEPPPPIACAVSGGPDSLALLVLAIEAGLRPIAYHVDHGLRPGSGDEVAVVERAAALLNEHVNRAPDQRVDVVALRVNLAAGTNLEARARAARFSVLPPAVATGHTADDQAETVLINLLRGSSTAGLAGMAAGPRHPILGVRRSETRAVCREAGLEWLEDPSNADLGPLRNRIRHQVLPTLNEASGRDLVPVLCRQSELLADDEALLDGLAAALDPTCARELAGAPLPLARRAIRGWLRRETGASHPPSGAAVERVLTVAAGTALACDIGGGTSVRRRRGRLVIESVASRTVK